MMNSAKPGVSKMFKEFQQRLLLSYIRNEQSTGFAIWIATLVFSLCSIAINIWFYTSESCTGIFEIMNIGWSCILTIVIFTFAAFCSDETKIISMSSRYSGHVKYNDISIEDRKILALNAFYMLFSWTFSGAIFIYIPFIILKAIGKFLVVVIPSLVIDHFIGDIKPKKTKTTLQEEFNDLIEKNNAL